MLPLLTRRILWSLPMLLAIALVTFALMHLAPGGPFDRSPTRRQLTPAEQHTLSVAFGLDKPAYLNAGRVRDLWRHGERNVFSLAGAACDSQFVQYLTNALHGDLGPSYQQRGRRVQDIMRAQWPYSFRLGALASAFAMLVGLPLGMLAALRRGTLLDYVCVGIASLGGAVPHVVIAILALIIFGTQLKWIAIVSSDWNTPGPYLVPALVLGVGVMAGITRLTRAAVLDVLSQDYIRVARAKGLSEQMIVWRHILPATLIPVLTILGPACVDLITSAVIVETIFGVPGIGRSFVDAIFQRDYAMLMGSTLIIAVLVVVVNTLVDIGTILLDPRIRAQG